MIATLGLSTLTALLIPLAGFFTPHPASGAFFSVGLIFLGAAQLLGDALRTIYAIHAISLRQAITPDRLLGRVNASLELMEGGIAPFRRAGRRHPGRGAGRAECAVYRCPARCALLPVDRGFTDPQDAQNTGII